MVAIVAMMALTCKNAGRVLALSSISRCMLKNSQISMRSFYSSRGVQLMSTVEGGTGDVAPIVIKQEKAPKEKKEKKEKAEKKEKVVAAAPGIEEIREARVNKLAAMREAGNFSRSFSAMCSKVVEICLTIPKRGTLHM